MNRGVLFYVNVLTRRPGVERFVTLGDVPRSYRFLGVWWGWRVYHRGWEPKP